MAKRSISGIWAKSLKRQMTALTRQGVRAGKRVVARALKPAIEKRLAPPPGKGDWIAGVAIGTGGARRFRLYRPPGLKARERLPLLVMLHGCSQDAKSFALSTRMNAIAARERFWVLYLEQDRLANANGCWNWFDTDTGRAQAEAGLILKAIDQVCGVYPADRERVAVAGMSAGASMASLLATRHPDRFRAVVMHSGVPSGAAHSSLSAIRAMQGRRAARPPAAALAAPSTSAVPVAPAALEAAAWPPLLVIHGARDPIVAADNGQAAARQWAEATGARATPPRQVQRGQRYPMTVTDYKRQGHTMATLAEVAQLGHAWSGGAAAQPFSDAQGPDASRMLWAFVARQLRV